MPRRLLILFASYLLASLTASFFAFFVFPNPPSSDHALTWIYAGPAYTISLTIGSLFTGLQYSPLHLLPGVLPIILGILYLFCNPRGLWLCLFIVWWLFACRFMAAMHSI